MTVSQLWANNFSNSSAGNYFCRKRWLKLVQNFFQNFFSLEILEGLEREKPFGNVQVAKWLRILSLTERFPTKNVLS